MKLTLICILILASALGAGENSVTIQKLNATDFEAIKRANEEIDKARERLVAAEQEFGEVLQHTLTLEKGIKEQLGEFRDKCEKGKVQHYRTVEIRGPYAIITEGAEICVSDMLDEINSTWSKQIVWQQ